MPQSHRRKTQLTPANARLIALSKAAGVAPRALINDSLRLFLRRPETHPLPPEPGSAPGRQAGSR